MSWPQCPQPSPLLCSSQAKSKSELQLRMGRNQMILQVYHSNSRRQLGAIGYHSIFRCVPTEQQQRCGAGDVDDRSANAEHYNRGAEHHDPVCY